MSLRDIDLERPLLKVTEDSERSVPPADTWRAAMAALERRGMMPEFRVRDLDGIFWMVDADDAFRKHFPEYDYDLRLGGKGPSRDQCLASAAMELVEIQTRQVHVTGARCRVQTAEDQPQPVRVFRLNSRLRAGGEEPFESLVPESLDRHADQCNLYRYGLQTA